MSRYVSVLLLASLALSGCASGSTSSGSTASVPRRDPQVISAVELEGVATSGDLYTAVQQLRPQFLQKRGVTSPGVATAPEVIQVYVDGIRAGDENALRSLRVSDVKEVRHLSASEATQKYGTGHTQGAIVVTKK